MHVSFTICSIDRQNIWLESTTIFAKFLAYAQWYLMDFHVYKRYEHCTWNYVFGLYWHMSPTAWKVWGSSDKASGWFGAATQNLGPDSARFHIKVPLFKVQVPQGSTFNNSPRFWNKTNRFFKSWSSSAPGTSENQSQKPGNNFTFVVKKIALDSSRPFQAPTACTFQETIV